MRRPPRRPTLRTGSPPGYLIDKRGRIASELAVGAEALLALARGERGAAADPAQALPGSNGHRSHKGNRSLEESRLKRDGLSAGTPAPSFRLPDLNGGHIALDDYRGRRLLLVFSDPNCGPCDDLIPRLQAALRQGTRKRERTRSREGLEERGPEESRSPRFPSSLRAVADFRAFAFSSPNAERRSPNAAVLMVSRGDIETNRRKAEAAGLTFPVCVQRQWEVSRLYAMFATPIAFLIDERGIIAADVAIGVEPILSLLAAAMEGSPDSSAAGRAGREPAALGR